MFFTQIILKSNIALKKPYKYQKIILLVLSICILLINTFLLWFLKQWTLLRWNISIKCLFFFHQFVILTRLLLFRWLHFLLFYCIEISLLVRHHVHDIQVYYFIFISLNLIFNFDHHRRQNVRDFLFLQTFVSSLS
jgi:hypothetical protein